MAELTRHVPIDKNSELGKVLSEAQLAGQPVVLEVNGHAYRFTPQARSIQDDPWKDYDPQRARTALAESAGALQAVDREQLLRDIYDARSQDSHGRPA